MCNSNRLMENHSLKRISIVGSKTLQISGLSLNTNKKLNNNYKVQSLDSNNHLMNHHLGVDTSNSSNSSSNNNNTSNNHMTNILLQDKTMVNNSRKVTNNSNNSLEDSHLINKLKRCPYLDKE